MSKLTPSSMRGQRNCPPSTRFDRRQYALEDDGTGLGRHQPQGSRALGGEAAGDERQRIGVRQMAWERELIERFSSSTRTAILTKTLRVVAKIAPRQRDRFGAARRSECRS